MTEKIMVDMVEAAKRQSEMAGAPITTRDLTLLFSKNDLRDDLCPGSRKGRMIPVDYLPIILMAARRRRIQFQSGSEEGLMGNDYLPRHKKTKRGVSNREYQGG